MEGRIMAGNHKNREPADSGKGLTIDVRPYTTHTVATVALDWRDGSGRHHSTLARWHLRLTRADLAGHSTDDVLRAIIVRLLHRLESERNAADYPFAVGVGVPLGTTGGTVTTDSLEPCDPTLPGL